MPAAVAIHFFLELAVILATCRVVGLFRPTCRATTGRRRSDRRSRARPLAVGPTRTRPATGPVPPGRGQRRALHRGPDRPGALHVPHRTQLRRQPDQASRRYGGRRLGGGHPDPARARSTRRATPVGERRLLRRGRDTGHGHDVPGRIHRHHRISDACPHHLRKEALRNDFGHTRPSVRRDRRRDLVVHPGHSARHAPRQCRNGGHRDRRWIPLRRAAADDPAAGAPRSRHGGRAAEHRVRTRPQHCPHPADELSHGSPTSSASTRSSVPSSWVPPCRRASSPNTSRPGSNPW